MLKANSRALFSIRLQHAQVYFINIMYNIIKLYQVNRV